MKKFTTWMLLFTLILPLLLAGCGGSVKITDSNWRMVRVNGQKALADVPVTLQIGPKKNRVVGSLGCNRFTGTYTKHPKDVEPTLTFQIQVSTNSYCLDNAIVEQEREYLDVLNKTRTYLIKNEQLILRDEGEQEIAAFTFITLLTLSTQNWTVQAVNRGGGLETVPGSLSITANFGKKNLLSGSTGCNTYNATYTPKQKTKLYIKDAILTTQKDCTDDQLSFQRGYLSAVQKSYTMEFSNTTLDLFDQGGVLRVRFKVKQEK